MGDGCRFVSWWYGELFRVISVCGWLVDDWWLCVVGVWLLVMGGECMWWFVMVVVGSS
jgi:hypothetical protein